MGKLGRVECAAITGSGHAEPPLVNYWSVLIQSYAEYMVFCHVCSSCPVAYPTLTAPSACLSIVLLAASQVAGSRTRPEAEAAGMGRAPHYNALAGTQRDGVPCLGQELLQDHTWQSRHRGRGSHHSKPQQ